MEQEGIVSFVYFRSWFAFVLSTLILLLFLSNNHFITGRGRLRLLQKPASGGRRLRDDEPWPIVKIEKFDEKLDQDRVQKRIVDSDHLEQVCNQKRPRSQSETSQIPPVLSR